MEGRKPKPTVLKILEGNPGKRPLPKNEPKPDVALIPCPQYLKSDRIAYSEWNRIVPELYQLGLLSNIDKVMIELYCSQYSIYRRAIRELKDDLITTNIRNGDKANPAAAIAREAAKIIKAIAVEFGLTPSSRGRIELPTEDSESKLEKMLRNRGV